MPHVRKPVGADVCAEIFADVSAGMPVRRALRDRGIDPFDFYHTLRGNETLEAAYGRAKVETVEAMADETVEIADDMSIDPHHKRIQVDTRKWLLSKMAPKRYGDKLELGGRVEIPVVRVRDMTGKTNISGANDE